MIYKCAPNRRGLAVGVDALADCIQSASRRSLGNRESILGDLPWADWKAATAWRYASSSVQVLRCTTGACGRRVKRPRMQPVAADWMLRVKTDGIIACPFVTSREGSRIGPSLNETPSPPDHDAKTTTTAVAAQNTTMKIQSLARKAIE